MRDTEQLIWETNATLVAFVDTELDAALLFGSIALSTGGDSAKRLRTTKQARSAYEAATRFLARARIRPREAQRFEANLIQIQNLLNRLENENRPHQPA